MHEAAATLPTRIGLGQDGGEAKVRVCLRPLPRQVGKVQVPLGPHAPVEMHRALDADVEGVLDHALDRREAGTAGHEQHRPRRVLAQHEGPEGGADAQDRLLPHLREDVVGEAPARNMPQVQLDQLVVVRGVGDRERPGAAVGEQELQILARQELQALLLRQLEVEADDVVRQVVDPHHAAGQDAHLELGGALDLARLQAQIATRHGLATDAGAYRGAVEGRGRLARVPDRPLEQLRGAAAALAVAAAVGQADVVAQRGGENGLAVGDLELVPARLHMYGEQHRRLCPWSGRRILADRRRR